MTIEFHWSSYYYGAHAADILNPTTVVQDVLRLRCVLSPLLSHLHLLGMLLSDIPLFTLTWPAKHSPKSKPTMGIPHTCYSFIPWVVYFTPPSIEHQVERNNSILRLFGRCMLFVCEIEIVKSSLPVLSSLTISVSHTNSMLHHTNDTDSMLHVHFIVSSTYVQLDYIYCASRLWQPSVEYVMFTSH